MAKRETKVLGNKTKFCGLGIFPQCPCVSCVGNRLELLPDSVSELRLLEVLTVSSNHLYRLPDDIIHLERLKVNSRTRRIQKYSSAPSNVTRIQVLLRHLSNQYVSLRL